MNIGVLSFQGDFARHIAALEALGVTAPGVRTPEDLSGVDGLVIPGGESTTIGMLCDRFGLLAAIRERIGAGMPVFGTCAGAILLAKTISASDQPRIGVLDITVERNAYGRQRESFEREVTLCGPEFRKPSKSLIGVFIRAPRILSIDSEAVVVEATLGNEPVFVRQGQVWAATFHPELTGDLRMHETFLNSISQ